jgi:hypothetical protein
VGKSLKPGRWESTEAAARRLKSTPEDVRRRSLRHDLVGFQVRPHGRWYVTSDRPQVSGSGKRVGGRRLD